MECRSRSQEVWAVYFVDEVFRCENCRCPLAKPLFIRENRAQPREKFKPATAYTGTVHITWAECPNAQCRSREWLTWDVVYYGMNFKCGTCQTPLGLPLFVSPVQNKGP